MDSPVQFAVNVAGHFRDEAGIGAHGRHIVEILRAAGYPCRITFCDSSPHRKAAGIRGSDDTVLPLGVNVVAANIDYLPYLLDEVPDFLEDRYTIAYWIWDAEPLPAAWAARGNLVGEVWAGSRYSAGIFARSLQQPVLAVPYGVMPAEPVPANISRADLLLPSGFLFLFCFDALSFERKNPLGLIEAFGQAFNPGEGPKLVIKSINGDHAPEQMALLHQRAATHSDITLIDGYLDPDKLRALMSRADAYVSLHRAEGWAMSIAEAMADGKPVIATRHSGNLDYMTDETSFLIDWDSARVSPEADRWIETGSVWAEPRLEHAAECMRQVFWEPDAARARGRKAAEHMRKNHNIAVSAQIVRRRLDSLLGKTSATVER